MTNKKLAEEFEKLRHAYKSHWLVKDCKAFENFCFAHSDQIAKILLSATKSSRKT